ncbi:MAG TPA: hypothetical protein VGE22_14315 [Solimonas sp.]
MSAPFLCMCPNCGHTGDDGDFQAENGWYTCGVCSFMSDDQSDFIPDADELMEGHDVECSECGEEIPEEDLEYIDPPTCKECAREDYADEDEDGDFW